MRGVFLLLFFLVASPALGQKVYKCTDEGGTVVFSQRPCADDPKQMETVDTSRALRTGSGGSVAEQGEFADLNAVRRACAERMNAITSRYDGQRRRITADIAALERQAATANNNLAGATYDSGIRQQIAGLTSERGALQQAEATERTAERERCASEVESTEERIAEARAKRQADAAAEEERQRKEREERAKAESDADEDK
ncbi:MAG: DUF4124 domain-containing protein [Lysobacterales bacterium]